MGNPTVRIAREGGTILPVTKDVEPPLLLIGHLQTSQQEHGQPTGGRLGFNCRRDVQWFLQHAQDLAKAITGLQERVRHSLV